MVNRERLEQQIQESDIIRKTFDEMPNQFTGMQFNKALVRNGYPKQTIKENKGRCDFLRPMAENLGYKAKTWIKNPEFQKSTGMFKDEEPIIISKPIETIKAPEMNEEKAIEFLKSKGYKIMKPVSNWEEI